MQTKAIATRADSEDPLLDIVATTWGFHSLRPSQREVMDAVLAHRDSLLVIPTGGGKSLCYQAPALLLEALTVVVSPLLALMKDQVDALRSVGVLAGALNSSTSIQHQREIEAAIRDRSLRLLFVSPERLASATFRTFLQRSHVSAFAIDEAHCISHWGHDFRPEYRQLRELRQLFPLASIHAFTATATDQVRTDIVAQLGMRDPLLVVGELDRPNLQYRVLPRRDAFEQVATVIRRHPGDAGIVYCIRRKDVEAMTAALGARGFRAAPYHAGLDPAERRRTQDAFSAEHVDVVVATVAFGMGIDRSNVRFVVHAGMPKSLEHYQQEAGRAGRDGLPAECVLLHDERDIETWRYLITQSVSDDAQHAIAVKQLEAMNRYCATAVCRHGALVEHFGGAWTNDSCSACDVCLGQIDCLPDSTVVAQKILSCVVRLREAFGSRHVAAVLRGERSKTVLSWRHDRLSTYGLLRAHSTDEIRDWIAQLVSLGALRKEGHPKPILHLGRTARAILRGETNVRLQRSSRPIDADSTGEWVDGDRELFDSLRDWRRHAAEVRGVAPFVLFADTTLRDVAAMRPSSLQQLRLAGGIGELRLREHGDALLAVVDGHCAARGLVRDLPLPHLTSGDRKRRSQLTATKAEA